MLGLHIFLSRPWLDPKPTEQGWDRRGLFFVVRSLIKDSLSPSIEATTIKSFSAGRRKSFCVLLLLLLGLPISRFLFFLLLRSNDLLFVFVVVVVGKKGDLATDRGVWAAAAVRGPIVRSRCEGKGRGDGRWSKNTSAQNCEPLPMKHDGANKPRIYLHLILQEHFSPFHFILRDQLLQTSALFETVKSLIRNCLHILPLSR